eukprot:Blabericola_migrator_1__2770@NODE_1791_length_3787_cov_7_574462_g1155_i0_p2_GENE_NODE_1791_length_3787_cov_7_574462_g1155_i0NODE_1791_length_3787_cov_7_574462_g1155_i0_p2_ORF_typecomplete_len147_score13_45_NODE_1791_length_3787_cov_7_574462_g1155_i06641104
MGVVYTLLRVVTTSPVRASEGVHKKRNQDFCFLVYELLSSAPIRCVIETDIMDGIQRRQQPLGGFQGDEANVCLPYDEIEIFIVEGCTDPSDLWPQRVDVISAALLDFDSKLASSRFPASSLWVIKHVRLRQTESWRLEGQGLSSL